MKILQRDKDSESNKVKEMNQMMTQLQSQSQQNKSKEVNRPSSAHLDGSPNLDKRE
jgi:hypothetical protein